MISPRHAVLLLDKSDDRTSFRAARDAARRLGLRKAGHTGTLDDNVTGLLVVAFEEATKGISLLSGLDKEYVGAMRLAAPVAVERLRAAADEFVGAVTQTPPERAAVKRAPRQRTVYAFEIGEITAERAEFRCLVEAGTYVRVLLADLGERLGVPVSMASLRRTAVGPFRVDEAVPLAQVSPSALMSLDDALLRVGVPRLSITEEQELRIRRGLVLERADFAGSFDWSAPPEAVSLIGPTGVIVAIARPTGEGLHAFRVMAPV